MKTIRHTLAIFAMAFSFSLAAQQEIILSGTVINATGSVNISVTLLSDDGLIDDSIIITTDELGFYTYSFFASSGGIITAGVMCGGLINEIQTFNWIITLGPASYVDMGFYGCDIIEPSDCIAYFYCWNDSIAADSLDIDPYQVLMINAAQGTDLTYLWDFGDGNTSTEVYPTYEYAEVGSYTICLYISSSDGCNDMACFTITVDESGIYIGGGVMQQGFTLHVVAEIVLGLEETELVNNLSVYPNPINGSSVLSIQSAKGFNGTIEVFNMQGQMVYASNQFIQSGQNQIALNVGDLSSGNYLLKLKNENGQAESIMLTK